MKLSDLEVEDVIAALRKERSAWIAVAQEEKRRHTESERATMSLLAALEHVLTDAASRAEVRR